MFLPLEVCLVAAFTEVIAKDFLVLLAQDSAGDHDVQGIIDSSLDVLFILGSAGIPNVQLLNQFLGHLLVGCFPQLSNNLFDFET